MLLYLHGFYNSYKYLEGCALAFLQKRVYLSLRQIVRPGVYALPGFLQTDTRKGHPYF